MKNILKLILISFAMVSCENDDQRKIVNNTSDLKTPLEDTSAIIRADLPIEIDSLDYIIHPIGHYRPRKSRLDSYSSYEDSGHYQSFSNYRNYSLDGDLSNLLFQHVDSNELKPLTSKRVNISSMTFLKDIFDETRKKFLVYEIFDQDTNMDGRINSGDIKALYLSNNDGSNLIKLTPNLQELVNWKLIKMNSHLYFKTLEDTDSNGKFDKEDNIHYFNINFNQLELQPKEYHPLEFQG